MEYFIMKIGINAIFFAPGSGGGIERYLRNLIRGLQRIDRENQYVLFTNKENTGTFDLGHNFMEYRLSVSARCRPQKIAWEQMVLPIHVKKAGLDVLFSPGNIAPLFTPCLSVVVIHDLIPFASPRNFSRTELLLLKTLFKASAYRADKVITVSESSKRQIVTRLNVRSDKVSVIYEACDEIFFDKPATKPTPKDIKVQLGIEGKFVLYTAATLPHKNMVGLLKAFHEFKTVYNTEHKLVIAGRLGPDHENLVKTTRQLNMESDVVFRGNVSDSMLPSLYRKASLFVYPSLYEGFGLPVLEAMASGVPVIASNTTSLPEVVGDAGLLIDPYNATALAHGMAKVLGEEKYRNHMIKKGTERVHQFSWSQTAQSVVDVLSNLYVVKMQATAHTASS